MAIAACAAVLPAFSAAAATVTATQDSPDPEQASELDRRLVGLEGSVAGESAKDALSELLLEAESLGLELAHAGASDDLERRRLAVLQDLLAVCAARPPSLPTDAYTAFYAALARARCLDLMRRYAPLDGALALAAELERSIEELVVFVEGTPDSGYAEPCHQLAAEAVPSLVQLELDLGRFDRAQASLREGRRWLGRLERHGAERGLPCRVLLVENQLELLLGAYDRVRSADEVQLKAAPDPAEELALRRLLLLRDGTRLLERSVRPEDLRPAVHDFSERCEATLELLARSGRRADDVGALRLLDRRARLWFAVGGAGRAAQDVRRFEQIRDRVSGSEIADVLSIGLRVATQDSQGVDAGTSGAERLEEARDAWLTSIARFSGAVEGGQGLLADGLRRDVLCQLLGWTIREEGDAAALTLLIATHLRGSHELSEGLSGPSVDVLPSTLERLSAGLLVYVSGELSSLVCAVDARGPRWFELEGAPSHRPAIELVDAALSDPAADFPRDAAAGLGEWLLPPELAEWIEDWPLLLVSGRDLLWDIDFEVLPWRDDRPLGLALPMAYVPSVPMLVALERRPSALRPAADRGSVLVAAAGIEGGPGMATTYRPLPEAGAWLEALQGPATGPTVRHVGDAARLEALDGAASSLLTVFAHGTTDFRRMRPSGIVLAAGDDRAGRAVWWDELRATSPPPLVSLLVCNATLGHPRPGNGGLDHPAGALLLAGATTVVAAGRELNALLAVELHGAFVRACEAGSAPAAALLEARRETVRRIGEGHVPELGALDEARIVTALQAFGLGGWRQE